MIDRFTGEIFTGHACIPLSWEIYRMDEGHRLVLLSPKSKEYVEVSQSFTSTFASTSLLQIQKIERVENPRIYCKYEAEKKLLQDLRKSEIAAKRATLGKKLFHGTSTEDDCHKQIIANGFNRSYAGSKTGLFSSNTLQSLTLFC